MKLIDIINVNCSDGVEILQKALSKTSWLERYSGRESEITLDVLESLYRALIKKYPAGIGYIQSASKESMLVMVKRTDNHAWIETAYFLTFFECMAKVILIFYGYFVKGIGFKDVPQKGN